jgi:ABC-type phosphate transport system permease subunit
MESCHEGHENLALWTNSISAIYSTEWILRSNSKRIIQIRLDMATSGVASNGQLQVWRAMGERIILMMDITASEKFLRAFLRGRLREL